MMSPENAGGYVPPQEAGEDVAQTGEMVFAEALQLCCIGKQTGLITFSAGEQTGACYLQHGQPLHAVSPNYEGEHACYDMLLWDRGGFQFDEGVLPGERTINLTWEQLLFEGARRADAGIDPGAPSGATDAAAANHAQVVASRIQGGVPKITIMEGWETGAYELTREYTHIGRVDGNDVVFPVPAVSSRHCMLCLSGSDIILRDLNSSNGTFVNGEQVDERILQLGDVIQIGPVVMKFESGVKRPKLRQAVAGLSAGSAGPTLLRGDTKPQEEKKKKSTPAAPGQESTTVPHAAPRKKSAGNEQYVSGSRAISFEDLQTETPKTKSKMPLLILLLGVLSAAGILVYWFVFMGQ